MFVRYPLHIPSFSIGLPFCLCALSHIVSTPLLLTLSFLSVFLLGSFIRDYASRIVYRSGADMLLLLRCSC